VMEYVDGASLRALLTRARQQRERTDVRLICRLLSHVAEALAAVHAAVDPVTKQPLELVHRDVSPENILLSRQGAVKLADFGIARASTEVSTTSPDVVRGKLRYLAPEQLQRGHLGPAIDVWALGVTLFEALTLRRPFPEDNEGQTVHAIIQGEVPALSTLRPDAPPELAAVLERCLRKDPAARYPHCHDLALDLERIASAGQGSVTAHFLGSWVERLAPPLQLTPVDAVTAAPPRVESPPLVEPRATGVLPVAAEPPADDAPRPSRQRWVLLAVGLALALTGAGLGARQLLTPRVKQRQVVVTSTPSGATVKQGTVVLGQTPWAGDLPLEQAVELEVSAPGFAPQRRSLAPGELAPVDVQLKRR